MSRRPSNENRNESGRNFARIPRIFAEKAALYATPSWGTISGVSNRALGRPTVKRVAKVGYWRGVGRWQVVDGEEAGEPEALASVWNLITQQMT